MAKQLRLDVAQLTDVGRKREHNEDNMAYVIPKDPQVMATKGSLFIVADGMGGHAAGEVASEIAVDTVSTAYYQDDSDEVPVALVRAIKRANAAIHQRAAENMLRNGMGTTCVAAVLRGNMAYIANVGDSRAYLIRGKTVKQISQDHSWVAEQVRAGLLTEDQARTHAQRNVITRSLGTQPDVEIDIFTEPLQEGDSLVLCTDGLSGLITEDELQEIVNRFVPQESVYHLVERANENGGPDNITAIVIRVNEVGVEPSPRQRRPVAVGGPEEDTAILETSLASSAGQAGARYGNGHSGAFSFSARAVPPLADAAPLAAPALPVSKRRRRGRIFFLNVALLTVVLLALVVGAVYYLVLRQGPDPDQVLAQATTLVNRATGELNSDPVRALQDLASAQQSLRSLQGVSLSDAQRTQLASLQRSLTSHAQAALIAYNKRFGITSLPCSSTGVSPINTGSIAVQARSLAILQQKGKALLYALGEDSQLYPLMQVNRQYSLQNHLDLDGKVLGVASANDGSQLYLLLARTSQSQGAASVSYELAALQAGQTKAKTVPIDTALTSNGQVPSLIAAWDGDVYVVFSSKQAPNSAQIVDFDRTKLTAKQAPLPISANVVSIAAFPNNQLFLLLGDGSVQSLQYTSGKAQEPVPVPVQVQRPIPSALPVSDQSFTAATPVPTVTVPAQQGPVPLLASNKATLSAGLVNHIPHLYVADSAAHRLLAFTPLGGGSAGGTSDSNSILVQLTGQYASPGLFASLRSAQPDPSSGTLLYTLAQNTASLLNVVAVDTSSSGSCA
ncbi:MAG: Stp1/IreP family PP2C-type Ser/Thr phosphatase [Thermogemmatispora sp.]|uniref:Stp1/IreP family PP2C-type Ser/Thr phosphatase n=1 Tax=Thermogemmatispora sp. TaxID=1968838 RepID=UPI00261A361B|nr:Stp1/IreP family PP2C-type Ser/Thr phosphatase [Thermogemmatispora sp.]MBX5459237.1 Stp1/IreP family PP2C-type Ser/Thr phosphatase [Thermogemmatispora sp.]